MSPKNRSPWIKRGIIIAIALIIVSIVGCSFLAPKPGPQYQTATVQKTDVSQTVALTGTTEAQKQFQLQFQKPGRVEEILVRVGSQVKAGEVLAVVESQSEISQLESQKAGLRIAQANVAKAYLGPNRQELQLNKLKIEAAQNDLNAAQQSKANFGALSVNIINQSWLAIRQTQLQQDSAGYQYDYSYDTAEENHPLKMAKYGIAESNESYYQAQESFSKTANDLKRQADELDASITRAAVAVETAKAQYNLAVAKPREEDVAPLKGQMDQAFQGVKLAEYQVQQTRLIAPAAGVVTAVSVDKGETASSGLPAVTINSAALRIKALVSEADIAKIQPGQQVTLNFDAFGLEKEFAGTVAEIYPAAEVVQGVVYYVVYVDFAVESGLAAPTVAGSVKPGMTANMTVKTSQKNQTLAVPARAVQYEGDQAYVQVLHRDQNNTVEKRNVTVGLQGDETIEILSGLAEGEEVVTFTKEV